MSARERKSKSAKERKRAQIRNQEKRVLAKGASTESSVEAQKTKNMRPNKQKISKDIGTSSTFGSQSGTAKRGAHFAKPPLF